MLGRKEVSFTPAGLAEVKSILSERSKEPDFGYEQQMCLDYANRFCKLDQTHYDSLLDLLKKIDGLTLDCAIKIADILPSCKSTVQAILAKDKLSLDDSQISKILEYVAEASKNRIEPIISSKLEHPVDDETSKQNSKKSKDVDSKGEDAE